jgi:hypothetical protein
MREKFASGERRTQLTIGRCSAESDAKGTNMKVALSLCVVVFVTAAIGTPAHADGPWCAYYGGSRIAATNCGFATFQQCLATVSGVGGSCGPNPQYQPSVERHRHYRASPY